MLEDGLLCLLGLLLALALTPLARRVALRIGAIDRPDPRRVHSVATPRLGGPPLLLVMVSGMLFASLLDRKIAAALIWEWRKLAFLLAGALIVTGVGTVDDIWPLRPRIKLLAETIAAWVAVYGGYRIVLPAVYHSEWLSFALSIFFIVLVANAINLVDGLDGLAVGECLIISAALLVLCGAGNQPAALVLAVSCGAMVGFLRYNFHPARIFLGDSGALLLGFIVGACAISTSHQMTDRLAQTTPFIALGLPLMELGLTVVRRILREVRVLAPGNEARGHKLLLRRPALFSADRDHVHHRLLLLGMSHRNAVLVLYGAGAVICAGSFALARLGNLLRAPVLAALVIASVAGIRSLGYRDLRRIRSELLQRFLESRANGRRTLDAPP